MDIPILIRYDTIEQNKLNSKISLDVFADRIGDCMSAC